MVYVPNADDATQPTDAVNAETATTEFQALKAKINTMVGLSTSGQSLPAAYALIAGIVATGSPTLGVKATNPMNSNVVLTAASKNLQELCPNAFGLTLTLPNLQTLLTLGPGIFTLHNNPSNGFFPIQVLDAAGTLVTWLFPNDRITFDAFSAAAPGGGWLPHIDGGSREAGLHWFGRTGKLQFNESSGTAITSFCSCMLTEQFGIIAYYDAAVTTVYASTIQTGVNGTNVGPKYAVSAAGLGSADSITLCGMTATTAIIGYNDPTAQRWTYVLATVNTATLTISFSSNTNNTFVSAITGGVYGQIIFLTSTTAAAVWTNVNSGLSYLDHLTINAGAVVIDTTIATPAGSNVSKITALTPTLVHVAVGTNYFRASYAAGSWTLGTNLVISGQYVKSIVAISATQSLVLANDQDNITLSTTGTLYGIILTDGSPLTQVTTNLFLGNNINATVDLIGNLAGAFATNSGVIVGICSLRDSPLVTRSESYFTVRVINGTPTMSKIVDGPPVFSGQSMLTNSVAKNMTVQNWSTNSNICIYGQTTLLLNQYVAAAGTNTSWLTFFKALAIS